MSLFYFMWAITCMYHTLTFCNVFCHLHRYMLNKGRMILVSSSPSIWLCQAKWPTSLDPHLSTSKNYISTCRQRANWGIKKSFSLKGKNMMSLINKNNWCILFISQASLQVKPSHHRYPGQPWVSICCRRVCIPCVTECC